MTAFVKPIPVSEADLPYRHGVGVMLLNAQGLVWLGRRRPKWAPQDQPHYWQMPQGGVQSGETALEAAIRELKEETGVSDVELLGEFPGYLTYDLPSQLLGVAIKGRYRGQRQRWFAMRHHGTDTEIDIAGMPNTKPEFNAWRWAPIGEVSGLSIDFKRQVYDAVVGEFARFSLPAAAGV